MNENRRFYTALWLMRGKFADVALSDERQRIDFRLRLGWQLSVDAGATFVLADAE